MQGNDEARFNQLVLPHLDAAYNLARWLCGRAEDAEDVTQEAFLRAFKFFDTFRGDDARSWILRIVRNTFYSVWRQDRSQGRPLEFDEELHSLDEEDGSSHGRANLDPESILQRTQDIRRLDEALKAVPVEFREALVLHEIEGLAYKEIAATLGIPIGTVMSRLARGRRALVENYERLAGERRNVHILPVAKRRVR